ncbi:MAG: sporulation protein YabP [Ruminococcaceae bacterium]|nr:sporulation protein YabP [Oscillospiraceae bacterium]
MDEKKMVRNVKADLPHNIIMENRSKISISGVENAESYNESEVILHTSKGILSIKGEGMNLSKLNLDSGEITVNGRIVLLEYAEPKKSGGSFLARIFK